MGTTGKEKLWIATQGFSYFLEAIATSNDVGRQLSPFLAIRSN